MKTQIILIAALFLFAPLAFAGAPGAQVDVVLNPMGDFRGKTADVKGFAVQKGDEVSAQNIVINLRSLKTGVELRDKHTQKYLDTSKYPEAVLVEAKGKAGKGEGKIRIRGIEKKISGAYKIVGDSLEADFPLTLSDFNINNIKYMGVGVEDQVKLHVVVPLKKD